MNKELLKQLPTCPGISKCLAGKQKKVSNKEHSYMCSTNIETLINCSDI